LTEASSKTAVSITDNPKGLRTALVPVGCAADSQSGFGYRIMVWSAGYQIAGTRTRLSADHIEQEKTE